MKQKLSLLAVVAALSLASSAMAADGTITITGTVTDTTCSIAVNGGTADATVTLPTVSTSSLAASGDVAGTTLYTIDLTDCSGTTLNTAHAWYEAGANVDTDSGRLNNNSSGTTTNVQVQLLNSDLGVITAGVEEQGDVTVSISSGSGTLEYYAQYYATGASTAGAVSTSVDYTIEYE
jgi:major type 1 subunit fimbrin (pilin)